MTDLAPLNTVSLQLDHLQILDNCIPERTTLMERFGHLSIVDRAEQILGELGMQPLIYAVMCGVPLETFARFLRLNAQVVRTWVLSDDNRANAYQAARDVEREGAVDAVLNESLDFDPDVDPWWDDYAARVQAHTKAQDLRLKAAIHLDKARRVPKKADNLNQVVIHNDYGSLLDMIDANAIDHPNLIVEADG